MVLLVLRAFGPYHPTRGNPGKTRVYLQKFRYTREIPGFDVALALCYCNTTRALVPTAARPACSSMRTAPCAAAASARERPRRCARHGLRCGRRGCANVHLQDRGSARHVLLRSEQLIAKKRRNKLAAADKAICYLTRGKCRSPVWT